MKTTELKKAINGSWIEIISSTSSYGYMNTLLILKYKDNYGETVLMRIASQANDLRHPDHQKYNDNTRKHSEISYSDYGEHYACKSECRASLRYSSNDYEDPIRCLNFFKLINAHVEKFNYRHVYPNCELSQVIATLVDMGAMLNSGHKVDGQEKYDWHKARRESKPQLLEA